MPGGAAAAPRAADLREPVHSITMTAICGVVGFREFVEE
jgi:hypothetical protein